MTRKEAIANHRKMWRWIADETERRKETVGKDKYFDEMGYTEEERPAYNCFCCQYGKEIAKIIYVGITDTRANWLSCNFCPLLWGSEDTQMDLFCCNSSDPPFDRGLYAEWRSFFRDKDFARAAKLARQIAELPEKEEAS